MVAEDKHVEYAEEVFTITESDDSKKLSLLCPTSKQRSRGDSLNRPTLTLVGCGTTALPYKHLIFIGHRSSGRWHHIDRDYSLARHQA